MQVTLSVGDAELLAGAHLRLTAGTRYGLVGRQASRAARGRCLPSPVAPGSILRSAAWPDGAFSRRARRNGVGKSSLLKAMGWGLVVGFPKSLRCLYIDQLEGVDPGLTPVEVVVAADATAQRAQVHTRRSRAQLASSGA